jgi:hypothetical protein
MGNRDKHGREKKKPKKMGIKEKTRSARPPGDYKPVAPTGQQPINTGSGESS